MKNFRLDYKAAIFWVVEKQLTSMSVVNANHWWCCCAVDAEPWNNSVCQHSVLPYLSSHNQYRMSILRNRRRLWLINWGALCLLTMHRLLAIWYVSLVFHVCICSLLCLYCNNVALVINNRSTSTNCKHAETHETWYKTWYIYR